MLKNFISFFFILISLYGEAQIAVTYGPELYSDRDFKLNKIIGGDEEHFYVYRIRSRGFGTDYYIEKYNKQSLKREFIKAIPLPEEANAEILDVLFSQNNICVFYKIYNKKTDRKSLVLQSISTNGDFSPDLKEIKTVSADKSQYAWFKVVANEDTSKFLIITEYHREKNEIKKINLLLMDAKNIKKLSEKELPGIYNNMAMDVIDYKTDNNDNAYFLFRTLGKQFGEKRSTYKTYIGILKNNAEQVQVSELPIANDYYVGDAEFLKNNNELVCAGFYKDVIERQGRDLIDVGVFYYAYNFDTGELISKSNKLFSEDLLAKLTYRRQQPGYFDYKIDYVKKIGNDIYLIGQQYSEEYVYYYNPSTRSTTSYWYYDYKDILVAKLNGSNNIDWVKNIPFRYSMRMNNPHIFMHYFVYGTPANLYVFYDDHHKNYTGNTFGDYDPKKIKYYGSIHGSNFIGAQINLGTGTLTRQIVFENKDYCFAPIQENNLQFIAANNTQIFVSDGKSQIIIYTENRGAERFTKLKLE